MPYIGLVVPQTQNAWEGSSGSMRPLSGPMVLILHRHDYSNINENGCNTAVAMHLLHRLHHNSICLFACFLGHMIFLARYSRFIAITIYVNSNSFETVPSNILFPCERVRECALVPVAVRDCSTHFRFCFDFIYICYYYYYLVLLLLLTFNSEN